MATAKESMAKITAHEKECAVRYKAIEQRLEDGSKRFDKLDNLVWAIYPFILATVGIATFLGWVEVKNNLHAFYYSNLRLVKMQKKDWRY